MEVSSWYWIILFFWILLYGWGAYDITDRGRYGRIGGGIVLLVLLILIGLQTMGKAIK